MSDTKILVVEDESIVANDILNMLLTLKYKVTGVVQTASEAIENSKKENPQLVLMDIMLQGKTLGITAAEMIYTKLNIPIVYLTSYTDETTLDRAKKTEPFGYLLKPFEERELKTTIEIALYKFKMEMKLKNRERFLTTILNSIDEGVIATDKEGAVSFINPYAEELTRWKQKDILKQPLKQVFAIKSEKTGKNLSIPTEKILKGENFKLTKEVVLFKKKKKGEAFIHQNISPTRNEAGKITGIVLAFSDISRMKIAEHNLKESWEKQKRAMEGTVEAMASTIETRDPYTAGHQRRVTKLAYAIAKEMNLSEKQMEAVRMASSLHDIGKIYVPSEILSKPGKITEVEYNIIKTHSQVGYDILKSIDFPWPIAEIVLQHHERLDGSGYPNGLKGKDIHLEAKILAVADVIEAMATHRPYRAALSIEEALNEIKSNQGKLYDSKVVKACLTIFKNKSFMLD
jgi:PAS domain S-box-containing protein/putative nucleotidyltransferase with HDIG domain